MEGDWKYLYILLLWGKGGPNPLLRNIFLVIFYTRNRAVRWFGRDHISFASGR